MPLSLQKLQELLTQKGFIPSKYFIMDGLCFYIELFSIRTADIFLLYIPSKYEFAMKEDDKTMFKIKYINMSSGGDNVTEDYAGQPSDLELDAAYGDNVQLSPSDKIETHLESGYKHAINITDVPKEDVVDLRSIHRQIRRLKFCVKNISYKLGVIYKNYICAIRRDDTISCFFIKNYSRNPEKRLSVIIDLETFYEKNEKTSEDIILVRESIYRVLEKNQGMHGRVMTKVIENKKDIIDIPEKAEQKKARYEAMIHQLEEMLAVMLDAEKNVLDKMYTEDKAGSGLHSDIQRVHRKAQLEKDLDKINGIKGEITKIMLTLRQKRENSILNIDKIMFDNTVMFDSMVKNFARLKEFT